MAPLDLTTQGLAWYGIAQDTAREVGNGDLKLGAGLVAAISPQMPWKRNVQLAKAAMRGDWRGFTEDKYWKCQAILSGVDPWLVLRGMKVRSFYANILGYKNYVTIDTWIAQHFKVDYPNTSKPGKGRKVYNRIARRIRLDASKAGMSPADYQAVLWCHVRGTAI